jgi:hypothetical protein
VKDQTRHARRGNLGFLFVVALAVAFLVGMSAYIKAESPALNATVIEATITALSVNEAEGSAKIIFTTANGSDISANGGSVDVLKGGEPSDLKALLAYYLRSGKATAKLSFDGVYLSMVQIPPYFPESPPPPLARAVEVTTACVFEVPAQQKSADCPDGKCPVVEHPVVGSLATITPHELADLPPAPAGFHYVRVAQFTPDGRFIKLLLKLLPLFLDGKPAIASSTCPTCPRMSASPTAGLSSRNMVAGGGCPCNCPDCTCCPQASCAVTSPVASYSPACGSPSFVSPSSTFVVRRGPVPHGLIFRRRHR